MLTSLWLVLLILRGLTTTPATNPTPGIHEPVIIILR